MKYYITIHHPYRIGEELIACPTGKVVGDTAEVIILTPNCGLWKIWIKEEDIIV